MTEGEFPFRSFTMREEGYDRSEVDSYVQELQGEITELRRALDTATHSSDGSDTRLHDPEGAVTRTLAIAQETADRVLHDAQVEADRRRAEADQHATTVIADADERAARLLADMETQAAEVREQGVAAARSAIQVERDKAMAELAQVRRVRDDLRGEAEELKGVLDKYRSQAREASDTLAAVSSGVLAGDDLPSFVDDEVVLAGIADRAAEAAADADPPVAPSSQAADAPVVTPDPAQDHARTTVVMDGPSVDDVPPMPTPIDESDASDEAPASGGARLRSVGNDDAPKPLFAADDDEDEADDGLAQVISIDGDDDDEYDDEDDHDDDGAGFGGTFLAEVRAAADDDVALAPENDRSDQFLSELRGIAADEDEDDDDLDGDAADRFFDRE